MPLISVSRDDEALTLTLVGEYPVTQQRLWEAFADPRQLERFWGPPDWPTTFTHLDLRVGGRAVYVMNGPAGEKYAGSWRFTAVDPVSSFVAVDGDDNAEDEYGPSSMTFSFEAVEKGSRVTIVTRFSSLEAMERSAAAMAQGFRAALPQLDAVVAP